MFENRKAHLEYIKATSFGKLANTIVGPFKPGMNVVYGPNEAGKTTLNELMRGVLFGWRRNTAGTNAYVPENADRAGSLFFKEDGGSQTCELKRVHNSEAPDDTWGILSDVDLETYDTMFLLSSGELQQLNRHTEVTAHLLTAGSGTSSSPARALEDVRGQIKNTLSRSANFPDSIANLRNEREQLRAEIAQGMRQAEQFREKEEYLKELQPRKDTLDATQHSLNEQIEKLKTTLEKYDNLEHSIEETQEMLDSTKVSREGEWLDPEAEASPEVRKLARLGQSEEYRLSDTLDELDEQRMKLEHLVDNARSTANRSQAEYEIALEDRNLKADEQRLKNQKRVKLVAAIVLPLVMAALGIYLFLQGQAVGSVSYTAFGIFVVVAAMFTATAGLLMNLQPSKREEELEDRRNKAEWVMQQDEKALTLAERNLDDHLYQIRIFLDGNGLSEAQGSIRRARHMLTQARELRSATAAADQSRKAVDLQIASLEESASNLSAQRRQILQDLGLGRRATREDIVALIQTKEAERTQAMQMASETNRRYGEVAQELSQAREITSFDEKKIASEVVEARLQSSYRKLATLLMEQRALEEAISAWERKSQPQVYQQASELFAQMTSGTWQQVRINADDQIEVVDAVKTAFDPVLLSLGTRQQLYLALRIALLLNADNVGQSLPIMCDDILVHFDQERRTSAAKALLELSRHRQVILFTCHPEIAALVQECDSAVNVVEL